MEVVLLLSSDMPTTASGDSRGEKGRKNRKRCVVSLLSTIPYTIQEPSADNDVSTKVGN